MNFKTIAIDNINLPEWGYKLTDLNLDIKLKNNIENRGQLNPIHVREINGMYEIIDGRRIFNALKELGWNDIFVYNHGQIPDEEAKTISLELDQTKFETDVANMAEIVDELVKQSSVDKLTEKLPFSKQDINRYVKYLTFDWSQLKGFKDKAQVATFNEFFESGVE